MGELCLQRKVIGESDCKMDELGKVTKKYKTTLHSDAAAVSCDHQLLCLGQEKPRNQGTKETDRRQYAAGHTWDDILSSHPATQPFQLGELKWSWRNQGSKYYRPHMGWDWEGKCQSGKLSFDASLILSEIGHFRCWKGEHGKIWSNHCPETCALTEISLYFHRKLLLAYISLEWVSTLKPFQSVSICKMTSWRLACFGSLGSTDPAPIICPPSNRDGMVEIMDESHLVTVMPCFVSPPFKLYG